MSVASSTDASQTATLAHDHMTPQHANLSADQCDDNLDGISGKRNRVWNPETQAMSTGRFGWKAEEATIRAQSAAAFAA